MATNFVTVTAPVVNAANTIIAAPAASTSLSEAEKDEKDSKSRWLATLVVLGVLGVYAFLLAVILLNLLYKCLTRKPEKPAPRVLPPEATERGNGAFLIPTPQSKLQKSQPSGSSRGSPLSAGASVNGRNYSRPTTPRSRSNTGGSTPTTPSSRHGGRPPPMPMQDFSRSGSRNAPGVATRPAYNQQNSYYSNGSGSTGSRRYSNTSASTNWSAGGHYGGPPPESPRGFGGGGYYPEEYAMGRVRGGR